MEIKVERTVDCEVLAKLNEAVQSLHQKRYPEEFKKYDFRSAKSAFSNSLSVRETYAFVAKIGDSPVGYILSVVKERKENEFQFRKTLLYIDQIAVEENYRNRGVGKHLLAKVLELATKLGIDEIQLDYWEGNVEANKLFISNGFECYNYRLKRSTSDNGV